MTHRTPPLIICPYCGPESIMYAGRVLSVPCRECTEQIAAHSGLDVSAKIREVKPKDAKP